jgi:hypothetical protein
MGKFKVGDKVRLSAGSTYFVIIGTIFTITDILEDDIEFPIVVRAKEYGDSDLFFQEDELILWE